MRFFVLVVAGTLMLNACAPQDEGSAGVGRASDDVFNLQIAEAESGGASAAQVEVLSAAREMGELTRADVDAAVAETFRCFDDAGISHTSIQSSEYEGLTRIDYSFFGIPGLKQEESLRIADQCINAHSFFVEAMYVMQPKSRAITDQYFTDHTRTPLLECLRTLDGSIDDGMTNDELWQIASDLYTELMRPYAEGTLTGEPTGCLMDVYRTYGE